MSNLIEIRNLYKIFGDNETESLSLVKKGMGKDELLEKTKINLAKFAIPKYIRVMKEFPKTQTGKIQKNKLREEGVTIDTWQNKNI